MTETEMRAAHAPDHGLERLIFFSDAVFAIVITLLVIELHAPELPHNSPDAAYWIALINLSPNFLGVFISFVVIGFFWAGHHRTLSLAGHFSPRLIWPNLMLLAAMAGIPFFTAFAAANPRARVPILCYCVWLLIAALFNRRLQTVATHPPVVSDSASPELIAVARQRGLAVILGAVTAILISIVVPVLGQLALATIPLWRLIVGNLRPTRA